MRVQSSRPTLTSAHAAGLAAAALLAAALPAPAEGPAFPLPAHVDQHGVSQRPFGQVFEWGEKLFEAPYNRFDGGGANLAEDAEVSVRYSRVPRADLPGFQRDPFRVTGPSAQRCAACHEGGGIEDNEPRDPLKIGDPARFIMRNPPLINGSGALQLLAEEATADLMALRAEALAAAQQSGAPVTRALVTANGVAYGTLRAFPDGTLDADGVRGVDPDLIVKPYQLKGSIPFLRFIVLGPADNSIGMQPVEMVGDDTDPDRDGVANELSIGDITSMVAYIAAQPRPVSRVELHERFGGRHRLTPQALRAIRSGETLFAQIGCAECHRPSMRLRRATFQEPSASPFHRFPRLIDGRDPLAAGLDPQHPVRVDLTRNPTVGGPGCARTAGAAEAASIDAASGACFPQFEPLPGGGALVRLYGDLKRHDLGPGLAEAVDEVGTGASTWKTRELWGVASSGPWLHDGRATTLSDAILFHGGEAQASRDAFAALGAAERDDLLAFLGNLVVHPSDRPPGGGH
jgi:cytochrome c peroxidase